MSLVPGERLELSQGRPYQILSLARLPISPPRQETGGPAMYLRPDPGSTPTRSPWRTPTSGTPITCSFPIWGSHVLNAPHPRDTHPRDTHPRDTHLWDTHLWDTHLWDIHLMDLTRFSGQFTFWGERPCIWSRSDRATTLDARRPLLKAGGRRAVRRPRTWQRDAAGETHAASCPAARSNAAGLTYPSDEWRRLRL